MWHVTCRMLDSWTRYKRCCLFQRHFKFLKMLNNCTDNGYLFSCFRNFGSLRNSVECKKKCNANYLTQFGLNDFYNFAERLNESNFLIRHENMTEYEPSMNRICKYPFRNFNFDPDLKWDCTKSAHSNNYKLDEKSILKRNKKRSFSAYDENICTQIKFDFLTRTWMDKTAFVTNDFEKKWSKKECFPLTFVLCRESILRLK